MADTVDLMSLAPPGWNSGSHTEFSPCARYYEDMDVLLYLEEDIPYRADRVDPFLTLLWHPDREDAVGVKLKGFRFLFQRIKAILRAEGVKLDDAVFVPMVAALEVAMTAGLGAVITADVERERLEEKYAKARKLIERAKFDTRELAEAA